MNLPTIQILNTYRFQRSEMISPKSLLSKGMRWTFRMVKFGDQLGKSWKKLETNLERAEPF